LSDQKSKLVLVVALGAALGGGAYLALDYYQDQQALRAQVKAEAEQKAVEDAERKAQEEQRVVELTAEFESFLNGFIAEISKASREYKASKAVMKGLVKPETMAMAAYAEENYKLGEATILNMKLQMDEMMQIFQKADEQFEALIEKWPEGRRDTINKSWSELRDARLNQLVGFFESENDVLAAMQELLFICSENKELMAIGDDPSIVSFTDEGVAAQFNQQYIRLQALQDLQTELMEQLSQDGEDSSLSEKSSEQEVVNENAQGVSANSEPSGSQQEPAERPARQGRRGR